MSSQFRPIEIPPGVVTTATKNMRSSNWSEVNLVRWIEGELQPVGGQAQLQWDNGSGAPVRQFASRCKAIHGWMDLEGVYHVAYVCEQNVYVDTLGALIEITPSGGWPPVSVPSEGGYGEGLYSADTYGTPREGVVALEPITRLPDMWSADNFGSILLVMNSLDGRLLEWDPASPPGTLLTRTTGSPLGRCFVVTQERFVMIFGMTDDGTVDEGSARRFGWCDQEDRNDWNFSSVVNQAGFLDVEPASPIVTAVSGGRFGTLFFTAKKAYVSRYIGPPYIYNYTELADNCTPWSPASLTTTTSYVLWFSEQGMFSFDGTSIVPVACAVRPWITDDIDPIQVRSQACAGHNAQFSEFWWFFPQKGQPWNTRAVFYNYKEGWWSQARMSRSAIITSSYTAYPIFADGTVAYQHEVGAVYAAADLPWAETFDLNLASGARLVTLKQVIPDIKGDMPNVQFSFYSRMSRSLGAAGRWTAPKPIRADGYVDARTTGRGLRMRLSTVTPIVQTFTVGQHLVDFAIRGDR